MDFDLRLPLGGMFALFGVIIGVYGLVRPVQTLDLNMNLVWGGVMFVFVLILLAFARMDKGKVPEEVGTNEAVEKETVGAGRPT